jgi:hypothetical protein
MTARRKEDAEAKGEREEIVDPGRMHSPWVVEKRNLCLACLSVQREVTDLCVEDMGFSSPTQVAMTSEKYMMEK